MKQYVLLFSCFVLTIGGRLMARAGATGTILGTITGSTGAIVPNTGGIA